MNRKIIITLAALFCCVGSQAAVFYIAPNGNDANAGTKALPLLSIQKAQSLVSPGDTVYVRGGTYSMKESQIANYSKVWANIIFLDKSGTENKRINYLAYPNEKPVFDFSNIKPANYRVHAFEISGSWLHIKGLEVTGVQVTITTANTESTCFSNNGGSHNIYEQLSMHDGQGIGFFLTVGSDNLILNCDAYRNFDYTSKAGGGRNGGNVDGFGNHPNAPGNVNNIFRGCRAWLNSDDGYDCINAFESTVFDNCWAFYNGYSVGFVSRADGNGFKAGGYAARPVDKLPPNIPRNIIRNCLSVMNKANGFYSNHHQGGSDWFNNTAYQNGTNYNMMNRKGRLESEYLVDVPGYDHVMKNNISLASRSGNDITYVDAERCNIDRNTFLINAIPVSADDFISLDTAQLTAPRKPDGSLPDIDFMHLKTKSGLIDKGVDVGLPYKGKLPDLGCFEAKR